MADGGKWSHLGQALAENSNQGCQEQYIGQDDEKEHELSRSISVAILSSDPYRMRLRHMRGGAGTLILAVGPKTLEISMTNQQVNLPPDKGGSDKGLDA